MQLNIPNMPLEYPHICITFTTKGVKKGKSISLLIIMGMLVFPWQLFHVCLAHPFGHASDHIPCAEREKQMGDSYWPPMECVHMDIDTDDFPPVQKQLTPIFQIVGMQILDYLICILKPEGAFLLAPEQKCRSAPLIDSNPFRGPPIV